LHFNTFFNPCLSSSIPPLSELGLCFNIWCIFTTQKNFCGLMSQLFTIPTTETHNVLYIQGYLFFPFSVAIHHPSLHPSFCIALSHLTYVLFSPSTNLHSSLPFQDSTLVTLTKCLLEIILVTLPSPGCQSSSLPCILLSLLSMSITLLHFKNTILPSISPNCSQPTVSCFSNIASCFRPSRDS